MTIRVNENSPKNAMPLPAGQAIVAPGGDMSASTPVVSVPPEVAAMRDKIKSAPVTLPPGVNPNQTSISPEKTVKLHELSATEQAAIQKDLQNMQTAVGKVEGEGQTVDLSAINLLQTQINDTTAPADTSSTAAATQQPEKDDEDTAPLPKYSICPQCSWNLADEFTVMLSDAEKEQFVVAVLGANPFTTDTALLNGALQITFRTLYAPEETAIEERLLWETRQGLLTSATEWFSRATGYRLAFATQRVQVKNGLPLHIQKSSGVLLASGVDATYRELLQAVKTESVMHALAKQYRVFRMKVEMLEANMANESFW